MSQPFRLGITMAGAVSAGAYTGGVMDYLFQALDAWYKVKNGGDPSIPKHDISIDIISGASAGGITGAMATVVLHLQNPNPAKPDKRNDAAYLKTNVFYNAWVNLLQDDMIPQLLDESDLVENGKLVSVLNSNFIEKIARDTLINVPVYAEAPPKYVSKQMELILTLSNLDGFTYKLGFSAEGSSTHTMKQHRDYAFFRLGNDYGGDGRIPLNLQRNDRGLKELVEAAPATGAFPIGLAYRKFSRKRKYILDNKDLLYFQTGMSNLPGVANAGPEDEYVSFNVDGGMLNNEPFDLTMKLMARKSKDSEVKEKEVLDKEEHAFDSTIIMIDPFPSDDSIVNEADSVRRTAASKGQLKDKFPYSLTQVVSRILNSMQGELLFKGEDIVKAFSNKDFSRFMIAPRRRDKSLVNGQEQVHTYNGSIAIACGALNGFAGFFDKRFREHDFYLGRANCQSFLRKYFRVRLINNKPVNPLFADGYSPEAIKRFRFQDDREREALKKQGKDPALADWYVPIIPDLFKGIEPDEEPLTYPQYDLKTFDSHRPALMKRLKRVVRSFSKAWWLPVVSGLAFFFFGKKIFNYIRGAVEKQFSDWRLVSRS